ncbi:MAG: hypothetical protein D6773_05115, partial [Alphaproteobacteria bacterium]
MTIPPQTLQEETAARTPEQAEQLCARLMENTGEMVALLDRETALLRNGKPHEITALQARKTALSTALTRDMNTFRQNSGYIRA